MHNEHDINNRCGYHNHNHWLRLLYIHDDHSLT
jgi:hypothetical protein